MSDDGARFQLGIDLDTRGDDFMVDGAPSTAHAEETNRDGSLGAVERRPTPNPEHGAAVGGQEAADPALDHWVVRNGRAFAGQHLIIDLWGGERLDDLEHIDATLRKCVAAASATLLHLHLHHFTPNGGVSGVAVLAESHISIHTWPEKSYAALDVFMCGDAEPQRVLPVLREAFRTQTLQVNELLRGECEPDGLRKAA